MSKHRNRSILAPIQALAAESGRDTPAGRERAFREATAAGKWRTALAIALAPLPADWPADMRSVMGRPPRHDGGEAVTVSPDVLELFVWGAAALALSGAGGLREPGQRFNTGP